MQKITFNDRVTFMGMWFAQNAKNSKQHAPRDGLMYLCGLALVSPDYPAVMRQIGKKNW